MSVDRAIKLVIPENRLRRVSCKQLNKNMTLKSIRRGQFTWVIQIHVPIRPQYSKALFKGLPSPSFYFRSLAPNSCFTINCDSHEESFNQPIGVNYTVYGAGGVGS